MYDKEDLLTNRRAFVNDDYKTHSQFTENYMVQEGLDFSTIDPDYSINEAENAVQRFEAKYGKNN